MRSTRSSRSLKFKRVDRAEFNQFANWSTKWANYFIFFIIAVRNFCDVTNQYRINEYYQQYARISSLSKDNSHFTDEFSIKIKQILEEASRSSRRNRFLRKLNDVVIFFNSRQNSTSFDSNYFFIIDSAFVFKRQTNVNVDSISSSSNSIFRHVTSVTSIEKTIHHELINSRRKSVFSFSSSIDNMKNRLNSTIQVIVNKTVQTILHVYATNLSTSQRNEREKRDERKQSKESEKSKHDVVENDATNVNRWNVVDFEFVKILTQHWLIRCLKHDFFSFFMRSRSSIDAILDLYSRYFSHCRFQRHSFIWRFSTFTFFFLFLASIF